MLNRKILCLLLFLLAFSSILHGYDHSSFEAVASRDRASQYEVGDRSSFWGNVEVDTRIYDVYVFSPSSQGLSNLLVLSAESGDYTRTKGDSAEKVIFSYLTARNVSSTFQSTSQVLRDIYIELSINSNRYRSQWSGIKKAIQSIIGSAQANVAFGIVQIDVVGVLKTFLGDTSQDTDWDAALAKYQSYMGVISAIDAVYKSGHVSYGNEIERFYQQTISIQSVTLAVDNAVGSSLMKKFGTLDFHKMAYELGAKSHSELTLIETRVSSRLQRAGEDQKNLLSAQEQLDKEIDSSLDKNLDVSKAKDLYHNVTKSQNRLNNLKSGEKFLEHSNECTKMIQSLQTAADDLRNAQKTASGKWFPLFDKLSWGWEKFWVKFWAQLYS
jgi:hypothetical protein